MLGMSDFFLVAGHVLLCLEIHAEKGIKAVEMMLARMRSALASALCKESRKKTCAACFRSKFLPVRSSDFGLGVIEEYFYRGFLFCNQAWFIIYIITFQERMPASIE